ncbi:MAG: DUF4440 domain-containing protein [Gemmatimonadota bacterium]
MPLSTDETAIHEARSAQNAAIAAGQYDRMATFWVRDLVVVAGLGAVIEGRDRIRAALAWDAGIVYQRTPATVTVSDRWPLGWEEGSWTGRRAGGEVLVSGRYSAQWVKAEGRWLIRAELFVALDATGEALGWPAAAVLV